MEKKPKRSTRLSRREFLRTAGVVGAGLLASAYVAPAALAGTKFDAPVRAPAVLQGEKPGLAPGMIGGPTGFEGAERYQ
ncbi:MAG: twin-arginine translocation signal domain-containing protein, partial [Anaerolineae bacterium]